VGITPTDAIGCQRRIISPVIGPIEFLVSIGAKGCSRVHHEPEWRTPSTFLVKIRARNGANRHRERFLGRFTPDRPGRVL